MAFWGVLYGQLQQLLVSQHTGQLQVFFVDSLAAYRPPAAMSADIWMSIAAWWHLIKHWAEEEREHYERGFCKPND